MVDVRPKQATSPHQPQIHHAHPTLPAAFAGFELAEELQVRLDLATAEAQKKQDALDEVERQREMERATGQGPQPPAVGAAHREGDLHIHDLDMLSGYCAGWSLRNLLTEGLNGVANKIESAPPRHLSSAVGQVVNFLGALQNEWAGAQAFSSFDTYMAPFVRKDAMPYEAVRQCLQEMVFNLNVPSRWGTQTPFTNLTFDWTCPDDLKAQIPMIGGEAMPFAYGDLQPEMDMINRAFIEVMSDGDALAAWPRPLPPLTLVA